ncbi:response regulator transcription factor [Dactylosporangium sp. NPDC051484]|uniref:response regulator transcription factor n=1 Tax=Dactylosporangium sp. NPDC051484 TaxID=3154942 RepID=UPI003450920E
MIRVLLADDEALIRAGVRLVLETAADIEIIAEASDGTEAIEQTRRHRIDVALLDIRMPKLDGLAAAEHIIKLTPATRVVMLTTFGDDEHVARALRAGAAGFLLKDTEPDGLIQAVRIAANGDAILSPKITRHLIDTYIGPEDTRGNLARQRLQVLTDRERDVLTLIGDGSSNADVAKALLVSEGTAKAHVSRILTKLGCTNRVQAAILAHDAGLLPPL